MFHVGVIAYMRAVVLAVVLILAACGGSAGPQARSTVPPSASPTPIVVTPIPTPNRALPLTWAAPVRVDHQPPVAGGFSAVSCPSVLLCVAVGGNISTSSNPTGGAAAWRVTSVALGGVAVSCPTLVLCVAVGAGDVTTSIKPTGGAAAWKVTHVDRSHTMIGISCPDSGLCVAVDDAGNVVTSTNPTGGVVAWKVAHVDGSNYLTGVSCPSSSFCVAVDTRGNVVSSTNPTGGVVAWKVTKSGAPGLSGLYGNGLSSVSCLNSTLCVAGDYLGNMVTSTNPAGGAAGWRVTHVDGSQCTTSETGAPCAVTGVSCISGLCVGADYLGNLVTSTNPTGGARAWRVTHVGGPNYLAGVSCPSSRLCVVVDNFGGVVTSTKPTGGVAAWTLTNVAGTTCAAVDPCSLNGVSCPSADLCVAVDSIGNVVVSSNPAGGAAAWTSVRVDGVNSISGVSCPSSSLCVAVDYYGNVVTSSNPTGGARAWKVTHVDGPSSCSPSSNGPADCSLTGVSCPNDGLCVAVDYFGDVVTSSNPTGGATAWRVTDVDINEDPGSEFPTNLSGVSCPTSGLCVAVDDSGNVVMSSNPTGGKAAWTSANVVDGPYLLGVSCPSSALCVAFDDSGNVLTSANPAGGGETWNLTKLNRPTGCAPSCSLTGVSCPSSTFCVAVDSIGNVLTSSDPTGVAADWQETKKDGSNNFSGVSCPSTYLCVAVDSIGNVITGAGQP